MLGVSNLPPIGSEGNCVEVSERSLRVDAVSRVQVNPASVRAFRHEVFADSLTRLDREVRGAEVFRHGVTPEHLDADRHKRVFLTVATLDRRILDRERLNRAHIHLPRIGVHDIALGDSSVELSEEGRLGNDSEDRHDSDSITWNG